MTDVPRLWLPLPYGRQGAYTDTLDAAWAVVFRNGNWRVTRAMVELKSGFWTENDAKAWAEAQIKERGE